jgi:hypothetical protein
VFQQQLYVVMRFDKPAQFVQVEREHVLGLRGRHDALLSGRAAAWISGASLCRRIDGTTVRAVARGQPGGTAGQYCGYHNHQDQFAHGVLTFFYV